MCSRESLKGDNSHESEKLFIKCVVTKVLKGIIVMKAKSYLLSV